MRRINAAVLGIVLLAAGVGRGQTPSFRGLGDLPGGHMPGFDFFSSATGVSNDGKVVVGYSLSSRGYEAFRWTPEEGMQPLGDLPGRGFDSLASAVSADGSVIVGWGQGELGAEGFRWTAETGMRGVGGPDGTRPNIIHDVSDDGDIMAGSVPGDLAALWRAPAELQVIGDAAGGTIRSSSYGISGDGRVIVGQTRHPDVGEREAFRWTEETGMLGLGYPAGATSSLAEDASLDGRVIVGSFHSPARGMEAFRWTSEGAIRGLGGLPLVNFPTVEGNSGATAVSGDGSTVVGTSFTNITYWYEHNRGTPVEWEAFIWDEQHGMRNLREVLVQEYGLNLGDWILIAATDISPDGTAIVGYGLNPERPLTWEAWLAIIPEPGGLSILSLVLWLGRRRRT